MSYYLSEAYSDLYNPRVDSYLNDNLRFIDYMQDEDIEEVVESVFWELRDYGNTLEEALDLLSFSASDEVITESYEELLQEFLTEASLNPYAPAGSAAAKEYQKYTTKSRRAADRSARIGRAVKQVRSRVDGGIARVKAGLSGAKGGMGRAAKALGSSVSNAASEGKARLGQLLRRGVRAAGRVIGGVGKGVEKYGQRSAQSGLETRRAGRVGSGGQMSLMLEPTTKEKTGGTLSKIGRTLRKAGVSLARRGKEKVRMSRADYEARKAQRVSGARASAAAEFQRRPQSTGSTIPSGPKPPLPPKKPIAALPPAGGTSGRPMTPRYQEALSKVAKAAAGSAARGVRFSAPGGVASPQRAHTDIRGKAKRFAGKLNISEFEELLDTILDSLVEENYASDYESALNIFLNLSEDIVYELTENFLVD